MVEHQIGPGIHRALLLIQASRYDLAEKELRHLLADEPQAPFVHSLLATCLCGQERFREALTEAQTAVHLAPDVAHMHFSLAKTLVGLEQLPEAEAAVRQAIALDSSDADYRALLAMLLLQRGEPRQALEAAEAGLQLDAEHAGCQSARSMTLSKLGRAAEAIAAGSSALRQSPANDWAHAVQGWNHLHNNDPRAALEEFRTALQLNPMHDWARQGMVEALKARNPLYRVVLIWFLWMARLSPRARWGIIVGLYVLYRVLLATAESTPALKPMVWPIILAYLGFFLLTWLAQPIFNLLLRWNKYGRYALSPEQIRASNALGLLFALSLAALIAGFVIPSLPAVLLAVWLFTAILPAVTFCGAKKGPRRVRLAVVSGLLGAGGLAAIAAYLMGRCDAEVAFVTPIILNMAVFSWVANALGSDD